MEEHKLRKQIIGGCILMGLLILSGSFQVVFSPFPFVRGISLISVICSSIVLGAFLRELYILREKKHGLNKDKNL